MQLYDIFLFLAEVKKIKVKFVLGTSQVVHRDGLKTVQNLCMKEPYQILL